MVLRPNLNCFFFCEEKYGTTVQSKEYVCMCAQGGGGISRPVTLLHNADLFDNVLEVRVHRHLLDGQ